MKKRRRCLSVMRVINRWLLSEGFAPIDSSGGYVLFANQLIVATRLSRDMFSVRGRAKQFLQDFANGVDLRKVAPPTRRQPVRPILTRTVHYQYDELDNGRLEAFYQSSAWKQIRYEALRRHGGRCQCCGASPEDGRTVLNVDHIKPLRVFWHLRLDIANLQVLCDGCNVGKGARHADDWRA